MEWMDGWLLKSLFKDKVNNFKGIFKLLNISEQNKIQIEEDGVWLTGNLTNHNAGSAISVRQTNQTEE